jgi:formylglycine-generating enzyme required for sulfatase activity
VEVNLPPRPVPANTFTFETVTVNSEGEIVQRETKASYFTEDLGYNTNLEMVYIPKGRFIMGSPEIEAESLDSERPQHQVTIKPFFMGKYPITQVQW